LAQAPVKKNKSAIKRTRQTEKRTLKNRSVKKVIKTLSKKVETEVVSKNGEAAKIALRDAVVAIDKAAIKGIIHKNTAARKVSRLTRLVNALHPSEAA